MQDWKAFFESVSLVEQVLSRDPAEVYSHMDFDTRDRYRKVVEELALAARWSEVAVAEAAIRLAGQSLTPHPPSTLPPVAGQALSQPFGFAQGRLGRGGVKPSPSAPSPEIGEGE
jgi:cyclic beta-1,2-glucan synthetase